MALALLEYLGPTDGDFRFRIDIGKNRYFTYAVGDDRTIKQHGVSRLAEPSFKSSLIGPMPDQQLGRGFFVVPAQLVDREHRYVQMMSFRDNEQNGPAVSNIIALPVTNRTNDELPTLSFSHLQVSDDGKPTDKTGQPARQIPMRQEFEPSADSLAEPTERHTPMVNPATTHKAMPQDTLAQQIQEPAIETVPFRLKEKQMSQAMFLGAIAGMLPNILPAVAPIAGKLLGGLFGGGKGGGKSSGKAGKAAAGATLPAGLDSVLQSLANPDTLKKITDLIGNLSKAASVDVGPTCRQNTHQGGQSVVGNTAYAYQQSSHEYSEALFAPALLAALPALMPLLKQVVSPENVKTIIDAPAKHTGMIINGLKDFAKLGIQSHEQDLKHLRELNPGVDDPALDKLLMSMSLGVAGFRREANYKRVPSVRLRFENVSAKAIYGQNKIPYLFGQSLSFPLSVQAPQDIAQAQLQLQVKHPDTLEVLFQHREDIGVVKVGPLDVVPTLSIDQVKTLEVNQDYLICVALLWRNKQGQKRGSSIQQKISLVGAYSFDRVEESSQLIPLNDMSRFREYWHKAWYGSFSDTRKRYEFDCKYYYSLNQKRQSNVRLETRIKALEQERKFRGKLKSGMELSPYALNKLLVQISPQAKALSPQELQALMGEDFADRFNQAASYQAKFRGRSGDSAALWIYPEFKLHSVVMLQANEVQDTGHIQNFVEHRVQFPIPAQLHFIGVQSD